MAAYTLKSTRRGHVLDLTCKYAPTPRQVSNCLTHMWSTTKKMSEEQRLYELQLMFEHPALDRLLQSSIKTVAHMNTEDIAYALLSMVNLGIPQRSRVVQTFLRHCQEKLNDFDEKSLSILASCLAHMEETASVTALKEGMRMLVEMRLPAIKSVLALQTMMRVLGKDIPFELKRKLEGKALSMTDQFTLPNTQYMISTMATMGFYSKPLLDACSKKIIVMETFAQKVIGNPDALTLKDSLCVLKVYSSLNYDLKHQRQPLLQNQEKMLQTVLLCLRLDSPALSETLTLPSFPPGDGAPSSAPPAKPWLSRSLRSLLEQQENTALQEMLLVENVYLIDAVITKHSLSQSSERDRSAGEERPPAAGSQRTALVCSSACCYGTARPRGPLALMIRHLEILGYDRVLVRLAQLSPFKNTQSAQTSSYPLFSRLWIRS
ncbi:unnamed protein product [Tetraodon nigroviridis]|uniref:(spotted green pufferfish) hypothetical protein n=1 Tax=Tetraodon nigroviridis TaxID=99883 RepID=Q4RY47_TETNG|nr:unnamed protein product [Tetraodon nigroviridis]